MRWMVLGWALIGCGGGLCDPNGVRDALAGAAAGDRVELGSCTIEGPFDVPDGVTLAGTGEATIVLGTITLQADSALSDLTVRVDRGSAVEADSVSHVLLERVTLVGPVTAENAADVGANPSPDETATHGIVATGVGLFEATDVNVRGFARFGALFLDTNVTWTRGEIDGNVGTGMMAASGIITITDLRIAHTFATVGFVPSYGAVFRGGAQVNTEGLVLEDNEGYGVLHDAADGEHVGLRAERQTEAAVWVQSTADFALTGGALADNALAGLVAIDVTELHVADTEIRGTTTVTRIEGPSSIEVGDGVQIIGASTAGVRLENLTLTGNERAGILIESADGIVAPGALTAIMVSADGDGLGAIAQSDSAVIPIGDWASGIERNAVAEANDTALVDRLAIVGAVAPMFLPSE